MILALCLLFSLFAFVSCGEDGATDNKDSDSAKTDENGGENTVTAGKSNTEKALALIEAGKLAEAHALLYNLTERTEEEGELLSKLVYLPLLIQDENSTATLSCEYNLDGLLTKQIIQTAEQTEFVFYTYDEQGNLLSEEFSSSFGDGGKYSYTYDENGNCIVEERVVGPYSVKILTTYDKNQKPVTIRYEEKTSWSEVSYTYDETDSVTSVSLNSASGRQSRENYTYDENKTCIKETRDSFDGEQWTHSVITYEHTYDEQGKLLSTTCVTNENEQGAKRTLYTYDKHGSLLSETHIAPDGTTKYSFAYDEFGRCTALSKLATGQITFSVSYTETPFYFPSGVPENIQKLTAKESLLG